MKCISSRNLNFVDLVFSKFQFNTYFGGLWSE